MPINFVAAAVAAARATGTVGVGYTTPGKTVAVEAFRHRGVTGVMGKVAGIGAAGAYTSPVGSGVRVASRIANVKAATVPGAATVAIASKYVSGRVSKTPEGVKLAATTAIPVDQIVAAFMRRRQGAANTPEDGVKPGTQQSTPRTGRVYVRVAGYTRKDGVKVAGYAYYRDR